MRSGVHKYDDSLPYYFPLRNKPLRNKKEYIHQYDIGDDWPDGRVWEYAKGNNLTAITKDSDFANRILLKEPLPKVIHIRFGSLKMNAFHQVIRDAGDEYCN